MTQEVHHQVPGGEEHQPNCSHEKPKVANSELSAVVSSADRHLVSNACDKKPPTAAEDHNNSCTLTQKFYLLLRAIRRYCLDCCNNNHKAVKYCPCDGVHSTWCPLWPYRFGMRPKTAIRRYGQKFLNPHLMPDENIPLEDLP